MLKKLLRTSARWLLYLMVLSLIPVILLRWIPSPGSTLMVERWVEFRQQGSDVDIRHQWVPYENISDSIKMAVIAGEDQRFAQHHGFDLKAIRAAMEHNLEGGSLRGASTISQQVAKNQFLWSGRSWIRKGLEVWFTAWIEILWPKQRILEIYLNVAEWDNGVFGIDAAARHHFNVSAGTLSDRQAAQLAAVLPSPIRWSAARPSDYVQRRASWIQRQARQLGGRHYLDQMEASRTPPDWLSIDYWRERVSLK